MKKNNSKHNIEIKNYEIIRDFIRKLFFMPDFNFKSIKELGYEKNKSAYHIDIKRAETYIKNAIKKHGKKKANRQIINDLYKFPSNFLLDTYRFSSYSINDLQYYFMIMQNIKEGKNLKDLISDIKKYYKIDDNCDQIIRNKLKELISIGYIKSEKKGVKEFFLLEKNILDDFDNIDDLDLMVLFFHNFYFLSVAGYDLLETIRQYRILNFNDDLDKDYKKQNDIFLYRYNPIHHVLDNDIHWEILKAINEEKIIEYTYINQSNKKITCSVLPKCIITEYDYGRQYLYVYDKNSNKYFSNRIDSIYNVKITNKKESTSENLNDLKNMWSISTNTNKYDIKIYFDFPREDSIKFNILKRDLYNTKKFGTITEKDGIFIFEIQLSDYKQLIPWINSFGYYALVDKDICPELYNEISEHTEGLMKLYELI